MVIPFPSQAGYLNINSHILWHRLSDHADGRFSQAPGITENNDPPYFLPLEAKE
jgi:hypothetical protein